MAQTFFSKYGFFINPAPQAKTFWVVQTSFPFYVDVQSFLSIDADGLDRLFNTIQGALDACVDGRGDTVLVMPGSYVENLTISKQGVSLIGAIAGGFERPDVVPLAGAALSVTTGHGVNVKHMRFASSGIGGIAVQQSANGFVYEDCVFDSTTNIGFRHFPNLNDDHFTASEGLIKDCLIRDCAGGGMSFENPGAPAGVGVTDVVVDNCRFYGNTGFDIFDAYTMGGNNKTFTRCIVRNCQFADLDKVHYIDLSAGTANDGLIANCFFANKTAALAATQVTLATNIVAAGLIDSRGIVDAHTF